jgi:ABC-2 type transport system permease protein
MFIRNTYNELVKIIAKPRSYIGFGAITLIILIILFAMKADGMTYISYITQMFEQTVVFEGNLLNGNFVAFLVLQMLVVHVPLLIALVTGDLISGEAATGTIRLLLTRPITRTSVFFSKFFAGCVYTFLILVWIGILALGVSKLIFGGGDVLILRSDGLLVLQDHDVSWRFLAAFCMAFLGLVMIATLSLALSCFSENSIGPIVTTMAIVILFTIIGALDVPALDVVRPYLFTTHMGAWHSFFDDPPPQRQIAASALILLVQIVVLLLVGLLRFRRKDITS